MAKEDDVLIQLATRIPKALHREIKLYCVENGISVMEFVAAALEDKLKRDQGRGAVRRKPGR
jgi:predicted HicB family RNase H-like nuclease